MDLQEGRFDNWEGDVIEYFEITGIRQKQTATCDSNFNNDSWFLPARRIQWKPAMLSYRGWNPTLDHD